MLKDQRRLILVRWDYSFEIIIVPQFKCVAQILAFTCSTCHLTARWSGTHLHLPVLLCMLLVLWDCGYNMNTFASCTTVIRSCFPGSVITLYIFYNEYRLKPFLLATRTVFKKQLKSNTP